jgi:hypothetical protein
MASSSRTQSRTFGGHVPSNGIAADTAQQARPVRRLPLSAQQLEFVLVTGLAGVFVVNAVVAIVEPSEIRDLVERSLVGRAIPATDGRWVPWLVAVNDFTIGALLLATRWTPRARPVLLAWAGAWLLAVALIKLTSLEALGG